MENTLNHRYIARIKVEATTPLFVGSGASSLITDSLVQKDYLGLPMIPGTSLAGVLRHSFLDAFGGKEWEDFSKEDWDAYFSLSDLLGMQLIGNKTEKNQFWTWYKGHYEKNSESGVPDGLGSRFIISSAYFLNGKGKVSEGYKPDVSEEVISKLQKLPTRQHVHITHKGVAEDKGLFDHEVLYQGARFIFEIELKGSDEDGETWQEIIDKIKSPSFRIGQGTRNGYGNLKVLEIFEEKYDLSKDDEFNHYLNFSPSFNTKLEFKPVETDTNKPDYELQLKPDDFFIFSEGFGDDEVDNKPVTEEVMEYKDGAIKFNEKTLIPASSIKGAIAHRVAFHYNKCHDKNKNYNNGEPVFADNITDKSEFSKYIGENNPAIVTLFGEKADSDNGKGQRGILILDDLYYDDIDNSKIFNHVAIDRFTGGTIDGALFSEKVSYKENGTIDLKINLSQPIEDSDIEKALEETLKDICKGLLPIGGMVTKGHGMFTGKLLKASELLFDYKSQKENAL